MPLFESLWFTGSWPWYDEPMASVASALVQKLNRFLPLNQEELASLAGLEARRRPIPAHTEVVHERQEAITRSSCRRAGRARTSCCPTAAGR